MLNIQDLIIQQDHRTLCQDFSLHCRPATMTAILGPNGAGKTTLLHTLAGLHLPLSGTVFLKDNNIQDYHPKSLAKERALLLQENEFLLSESVFEAVMMGRYPHRRVWESPREHEQVVMQCLEKMALVDQRAKRVDQCSGGERRRVALARVFAQATPLLLLDEPTNHLDIDHAVGLFKMLRQSIDQDQKTVVVATHDINMASHFCDDVILLYKDGEVIAGPAENVLCAESLKRLFGQAFESHTRGDKQHWMLMV